MMRRRTVVRFGFGGIVLVGTLAFAVSACFLYDDRCGDESRDISATTRFVEAWDPQAGFAQVTLVQYRTREPLESMWWVVLSDSLKGHIEAARLVDTGANLATLLDLPPESGVANEALRGELGPYVGLTPFEELFQRVLDGRVALELVTDIPGRELLRQTLVPHDYSGWGRPHCS
ncbi:MAG: hypothetical protein IH616_10620 [Gemmatimonadales bacterium]|nr:hypothetical protein [Gemmatimonadales bacterium]